MAHTFPSMSAGREERDKAIVTAEEEEEERREGGEGPIVLEKEI